MVEVRRRERESISSLLRRFTRRVQQSGILLTARRSRFFEPAPSKRKIRESALRRVVLRAERERLRKLGKLEPEFFPRRRR
ncbi:30S ribosomal protein S21 [Candidatus Azambacteria bacterium]|nr:30S ribosomal protein S21 [Candidatus Azambacteria bacterium]